MRATPHFPGVRLHIITGKGGTGKTTVAAALAISLATDGRRVLLTETEGRQGIAQLFDCPPLPYEERKICSAPGGKGGSGEVVALAIDVEAALLDYLEMFYNLKRAGRALKRLGAVDFATTIAPGLRDVLITGKLKEATMRGDQRRPSGKAYDSVVVDAPPTGRIARFLNVTADVAGLAKGGAIRAQADSVMNLLHSPKAAVHVVTVLEEMPVQETVDGVADLVAAGLPVGGVLVNMTRTPLLPADQLERAAAGELDIAALAAGLAAAAIDDGDDLVGVLAGEAAEHAGRVALEQAERVELAALHRPLVELPLLPDTVDLGGLYRLAETLHAAGFH